MNLQAAVKRIAPAGGIRPASHITASPVSATKAGSAAHYLAAVIEGTVSSVAVKRHQARVSDLSRSSTLSGQHGYTDECYIGRQRSGLSLRTVGATSISGGIHGLAARVELKSTPHWSRKIGNPRVEKVRPHRPRQNKGAASLTKAHGAFRKIGEAVMASEPDACAGVGSPPAGNANHHRLQCASGH